MKKQTMSLAVASALMIGGTSALAAMHVNDRGLGETLIYPFYSAANGNDTYVHVVNTTSLVKAVKVRFIEAENSQEVLDFNLYLSPNDEWAGAITKNPAGDGAIIRTVDNSCTVPELGTQGGTKTEVNGKIVRDQPFVNFKYLTDKKAATSTDPGFDNTSIIRTLEGYVEIIEMGQLLSEKPAGFDAFTPAQYAAWLLDTATGKGWAATHGADGVPYGCAKLVDAWAAALPAGRGTGAWVSTAGQSELTTTWLGGGLYGLGVLINPADGTASGTEAIAIDQFYGGLPLHYEPGDELPSLAQANTDVTIFTGGVSTDYELDDGNDAVSALFMTTSIMNDYVTDPDINALSDWIITMPTKKAYVNGTTAIEPFSSVWNGKTACEPVALSHWDREEAFKPSDPSGPGFSPRPPQAPGSSDLTICTEVSVLTFAGESAVRASSNIRYGFTPDYVDGWASLSFAPGDLLAPLPSPARELYAYDITNDEDVVFHGLPALGYAVFKYQNVDLSDATAGVIANYAAAVVHKTVSDVTIAID